MNTNDFRDDLKPTRGQHEQIAREFARLARETYPGTRVEATELVLRLKTTQTPDHAAQPAAAASEYLHAAESSRNASRAAAAADRVRGRSAGNAR